MCLIDWKTITYIGRNCTWQYVERSLLNKVMKSDCDKDNNTKPLYSLNSLRPRQNGRHFADDIFKCIFLNETIWTPIKISLKFVPKGPINNIPALVQIMAWRRSGDKPLSEPMMVILLTHICVTGPQWVNTQTSAVINIEDYLRNTGSFTPCHSYHRP